jgi:hypothetical protein
MLGFTYSAAVVPGLTPGGWRCLLDVLFKLLRLNSNLADAISIQWMH